MHRDAVAPPLLRTTSAVTRARGPRPRSRLCLVRLLFRHLTMSIFMRPKVDDDDDPHDGKGGRGGPPCFVKLMIACSFTLLVGYPILRYMHACVCACVHVNKCTRECTIERTSE